MTLYALAMFSGHTVFTLVFTFTQPATRHRTTPRQPATRTLTLDHYLLPKDAS